jgi:hypothetical protein
MSPRSTNKEELLARAHREAQLRSVPVAQVLLEQLVALHEVVERSEILDMHDGCTPNGGCPIAEFRCDYNVATRRSESLGLMSAYQFESQSRSRVAQEPSKFKIGKKGLALLTEKFGRELTQEEIDGLERGAEEELASLAVST